MSTRLELLETARKYRNVRFKHQGRTANGLDCLGLLVVTVNEVFGTDYSFCVYRRRPDPYELKKGLDSILERIRFEDTKPGDIVLMTSQEQAVHLGFLTDGGIIHAAAMFRKVVEHDLTPNWRRDIVACYRIPGIDD